LKKQRQNQKDKKKIVKRKEKIEKKVCNYTVQENMLSNLTK